MRYKLISCEVLYREMCDAVARSPHIVDVEFHTKGLHDLGMKPMREALQAAVDAVDGSRYDAILMGYALCGNGLNGLRARNVQLVLPRAHDCIALLFGSRQKYQAFFDETPGVYFRSTGWLERGEALEQVTQFTVGMASTLEGLIEKYGEDNGRYLFEELHRYRKSYRQLTYIETGIESSDSFEKRAKEEADHRGWTFTKMQGDLRLFRQLVDGQWDNDDFLVVPPGFEIAATYDDGIVRAVRSEP